MTRPPNRRDADCCMTCEQHLQSVLNGLHTCDLHGGVVGPGEICDDYRREEDDAE